jgi:hypothetical protein
VPSSALMPVNIRGQSLITVVTAGYSHSSQEPDWPRRGYNGHGSVDTCFIPDSALNQSAPWHCAYSIRSILCCQYFIHNCPWSADTSTRSNANIFISKTGHPYSRTKSAKCLLMPPWHCSMPSGSPSNCCGAVNRRMLRSSLLRAIGNSLKFRCRNPATKMAPEHNSITHCVHSSSRGEEHAPPFAGHLSVSAEGAPASLDAKSSFPTPSQKQSSIRRTCQCHPSQKRSRRT